jgi:hypothetical protein
MVNHFCTLVYLWLFILNQVGFYAVWPWLEVKIMSKKLSAALVAMSIVAIAQPAFGQTAEEKAVVVQKINARIKTLEEEGKRAQFDAELEERRASAQVSEAQMLLGQARGRANTSLEAAKAALVQARSRSDAAAVAAAQARISAVETAGQKEILDAGKFLEMRMFRHNQAKQNRAGVISRSEAAINKERAALIALAKQ